MARSSNKNLKFFLVFIIVSAVFWKIVHYVGPPSECSGYVVGDPPLLGQGKRVLVTGAAGFIGSHVAQACKDLGMTVVAFDDMSGGFRSNVPSSVDVFYVGDAKDPLFLEKLFQEHGKFDYVYHLAAYAAEGLSHFIRSYNYRNNLVGSAELMNMAVKHGVKCFVFTSSIAVYGTNQIPMTEETVPMPEDPYGISKYAFELDLRAAHEMFGMEFVVFRPHNVYGPHQNTADKYRNVIGIFINQILHDKPLTIFGDGLQTRAFSYVSDVAPVIAKGPLVAKARNQVFNIGADTPYTLNNLAHEVAIAMGVPENVIHLEKRNEVMHAQASHRKLHCMFGTGGKFVSLHDGLAKTVEWVKAIGKKFSPVEFEAVEIKTNMPPSWGTNRLQERAKIIHNAFSNPMYVEDPKDVLSYDPLLPEERKAREAQCKDLQNAA